MTRFGRVVTGGMALARVALGLVAGQHKTASAAERPIKGADQLTAAQASRVGEGRSDKSSHTGRRRMNAAESQMVSSWKARVDDVKRQIRQVERMWATSGSNSVFDDTVLNHALQAARDLDAELRTNTSVVTGTPPFVRKMRKLAADFHADAEWFYARSGTIPSGGASTFEPHPFERDVAGLQREFHDPNTGLRAAMYRATTASDDARIAGQLGQLLERVDKEIAALATTDATGKTNALERTTRVATELRRSVQAARGEMTAAQEVEAKGETAARFGDATTISAWEGVLRELIAQPRSDDRDAALRTLSHRMQQTTYRSEAPYLGYGTESERQRLLAQIRVTFERKRDALVARAQRAVAPQ